MTTSSRVLSKVLIILLTLFSTLLIATRVQAQDSLGAPAEEFMRATVVRILQETQGESFGIDRTSQHVILRITSGAEKGKELPVENGILGDRPDMRLTEGETVILRKMKPIRYGSR